MKKKNNNSSSQKPLFTIFRAMSGEKRIVYTTILLTFLLSLGIIIVFIQLGSLFRHPDVSDFSVGERAERDFVIDRDITYKDQEATKQKIEARKKLVPPVFEVEEEIIRRALILFEEFSNTMYDLYTEEMSLETLYLKIQTISPGLFEREELELLINFENVPSLLSEGHSLVKDIMRKGVPDPAVYGDYAEAGKIELKRERDNEVVREEIPISKIITVENVFEHVFKSLLTQGYSEEDANALAVVTNNFISTNAFYNEEETEKKKNTIAQEVEPVYRELYEGERIVKKGFLVTESDMEKITAFGQYTTTVNTITILGSFFFLFILFVLAGILLHPPVMDTALEMKGIFLLIGSYFFFLMVAVFFYQAPVYPAKLPLGVVLPTALISMVLSIIMSRRKSIVFVLLLSFLVLLLSDFDSYSFLFVFLSGIAGTLVILGAEKRIDLVRATFLLALSNASIILVVGVLEGWELMFFGTAMLWAALNGFICGILNLSFLPILEHVLNEPTIFRLMELSDTNAPLLKKMLIQAPGTYGHSLSVANMAETACRNINANALLARVGAYYHDIGKIDQPEYFIENQQAQNKHDDLTPNLSVAVIKAHVKMGIEKAKKLKLPKKIVNIIAEHHGSGLISYFYSEALKKEKSKELNPEDYSYNGTPPTSKEAAVVMLADSVEAATRTLKKPTLAKLEKFIWNVLTEKFISGQMNNSEITFRELKIISSTFVQIITGHFHSRIEYPNAEKGEALK